ncbi:glycosyltransferase family 39 protein [Calothrix sp. PCC 7507]|uniref:ArnT family glycosyltransferase n=1 Tax=Calothrix sp. PCC 7507 TaxID=99598 RepID=UPI00029F4C23|nr:glycosyltransferase family 39 protein [Calothrix sp. PCC 7507]AFY33575.1 glycosyl transferase family protein [Calothrix sp. PCC 7507]
MLYKQQLFRAVWQQTHRLVQFPYCSLLIWMLPLLLCSSGESSLIAHDEGLYAWRSRQMLDLGDWVAPWGHAHHKTPGIYWLIAITYKLFGTSEASARLPSMIAGIFSLLIFYEIGNIFLGKKLAWLAAAILSVEFLWLQSCRMVSPDVPMIMLVLLAILSLLKAEIYPKYSSIWIFIGGLSFGLGFLVRSFMIFLPMIALLPYLIGEHRRHRHLAKPMLYLGFAIGLIPTLIWLWFSWWRYGNLTFGELFQFVWDLNSEERNHNGILFYLWNLPLKSFPWFFFSLLGLGVTIYRPLPRYQLILVGFPLVLFAELSLFSTRLPHYALCLYPFIALLASVGLEWLGKIYDMGFIQRKEQRKVLSSFVISAKANLPRNLSYGFGLFSVVLLLASIIALTSLDAYISKYATLAFALGLGWLTLPLVWMGRYHFGQKFLSSRYWVASWLIPCWLTLALAGSLGFLGDYNPEFRVFFQQKAIASILQSHPVYFAQADDKNSILLNFYTPIHGKQVKTISQLPLFSYAWISAPKTTKRPTPYRIIGTVQDYQLIQVLP